MDRERLARTLEREDLTLEELVEEAGELLSELAPKQSRYKVSERPDARTIRYYVTQKLLPKPVSYEGGRARYSGRHLARLLWIKKLQAEHHTLRRIASVLERASDEDVLRGLFPERARRRPAAMKRVRAELLVDAASTSELLVAGARTSELLVDATTTSELFERRALGYGASLDVPHRTLRDPKLRAELADRLESVARSLRERAEEDEGGNA